jgi:hypothetical protein
LKIGQILHLKSEIRNLKLDRLSHALSWSNLQFRDF